MKKIGHSAAAIRASDLETVRAAGWSDQALYDAITVCALFQFYNTWVDANGVQDMPAAVYAATGSRLATRGYVPPELAGDAK